VKGARFQRGTTPARQLVRSTRQHYAIVAIIELARGKGNNPEAPTWLEEDYHRAIRELAEIGAAEIWRTDEPDTVRAIHGVIAVAKDLRTYGKFLVKYSEDELLDIESRAGV
jgi:hypothetical protein